MQTTFTNAKIEWLPRKVKRRLRTPLHQGNRGWLAINVPKRMFFNALADAKDVPIRVSQVHLAHVPRHVGWWESDVQPGGYALSVDFVNVLHPHGHPGALVGCFISFSGKRRSVRTFAAATLRPLAKKYLAFA